MQGQLCFIAMCCLRCRRFIEPLIAQSFKWCHVLDNQGIGSSIRGKGCGYSLLLHGQTRSGVEPTVHSVSFKETSNLVVLFVLPPSSSQVNAWRNASVFHTSAWRALFIKTVRIYLGLSFNAISVFPFTVIPRWLASSGWSIQFRTETNPVFPGVIRSIIRTTQGKPERIRTEKRMA